MLLAAHTPEAKRDEAIFEIVNQLNRGSHLITSVEERERVVGLNLIAGRRAKSATAYDAALKYLRAGSALLTEDAWERHYELVFAIEHLMAECELLTSDMPAAELRLLRLAERARSRHDYSIVTRLQIMLYTNWDKSDRGLDVFLEWLRRGGTDWTKHPTREEAMREYERVWTLLGNRQIEDLVDLPLIADPEVLDTLEVFSDTVTPSFFSMNTSHHSLSAAWSASLEYGNCDASCYGYVWLAVLAGPRFGNYKEGYRFGQLGYDLVEKRGLTRYQARAYVCVGSLVMPWTRHPSSGREWYAGRSTSRTGWRPCVCGLQLAHIDRAQPGGRSASRGSPGGSRTRPGFFPEGPTGSCEWLPQRPAWADTDAPWTNRDFRAAGSRGI